MIRSPWHALSSSVIYGYWTELPSIEKHKVRATFPSCLASEVYPFALVFNQSQSSAIILKLEDFFQRGKDRREVQERGERSRSIDSNNPSLTRFLVRREPEALKTNLFYLLSLDIIKSFRSERSL